MTTTRLMAPILVAADGGEAGLVRGHGLPGEDGAQLVRGPGRIAVQDRLEVTAAGRPGVAGQFAFEFRAPAAGGLPAGGLGAGDEYACSQVHDDSSATAGRLQDSSGLSQLRPLV